MASIVVSWLMWGGLVVLAILLVLGRHWLGGGRVTGCCCGCGIRPHENHPRDPAPAPPTDAAA